MKIGIVGGGQLGRMLVEAGLPLGHSFTVLDPTHNCPAAQVGAQQIEGAYDDFEKTLELSRRSDVLTFEIERFNPVMKDLIRVIFPPISVLEIIVDKVIQKRILQRCGLPISRFDPVSSMEEVVLLAREISYPLMLKARRGGYDGYGNYKVNSQKEIQTAWETLQKWGDLYVEQFVPFTKELAVVVVRDPSGNVVTYPTVETIHENNICDTVMSPAEIPGEVDKAAQEIAQRVAQVFRTVGTFAVEFFFVNRADELYELWINECAPRVHNSGHLTMDGFNVSQFTNHIQAITRKPLVTPERTSPALVMKNILGRTNEDVPFPWPGLEEAQKLPNTTIYTYGKTPRLGRKLGHINVTGESIEDCREIAGRARDLILV